MVSDSFADASTLVVGPTSAAVTVTGSNQSATLEAGELQPSCAPIVKTVWYRVMAAANGVVTASTEGSQTPLDTVLAIYTVSSTGALSEVICDDDGIAPSGASLAEFAATAGQTYAVQLGGYAGSDESGTFQLTLTLDTSRTAPDPTRTPMVIQTYTPYPTATPITPTATVPASSTPNPLLAAGALAPAGVGGTRSAGQSLSGPVGTAGGSPGTNAAARATPIVRTVSALSPSVTRLSISPGFTLAVTLDADAISTLQTALPAAVQVWISLDPEPVLANEVQRGSLGGGAITPAGYPLQLTLEVKDSLGNALQVLDPFGVPSTEALQAAIRLVQVDVDLPVLHHLPLPDGQFTWLQSASRNGAFVGYLRPPALFLPPAPEPAQIGPASARPLGSPSPAAPPLFAPLTTAPGTAGGTAGAAQASDPASTTDAGVGLGPLGAVRLRLTLDTLHGALFLPAQVTPAYLQAFDPQAHIYSGPFDTDVDYGVAGPQFTTFTVVAPQVGTRIFVYNPFTQNYGWIDALKVGPVPGPS